MAYGATISPSGAAECAEKDSEKAVRDDSSSEQADGTKPVTNAFTSVDDNRDAHSYDDLPRSLMIKTDLRLIPTLAFMSVDPPRAR